VQVMADVIGGERTMVSRCGAIQKNAASLASLRDDDTARVDACAHAASCRACAAALAEGAMVIAWIDAALAEPTPKRSDALATEHGHASLA
jgi:hypothetical protein